MSSFTRHSDSPTYRLPFRFVNFPKRFSWKVKHYFLCLFLLFKEFIRDDVSWVYSPKKPLTCSTITERKFLQNSRILCKHILTSVETLADSVKKIEDNSRKVCLCLRFCSYYTRWHFAIHNKLSSTVKITYPICNSPLLRSARAASLRYRNRPEITVTSEQKLYLVWFSCRRKHYLI